MKPRALLSLVLLLAAIPARAETVAVTVPVGALAFDVPVGLSGMSFPLIARDAVAGRLTGGTGNAVEFEAVTGAIGPRLEAGAAYYLEITAGAAEGERLDVDVAATIAAAGTSVTVRLGADTASTVASLNGLALAGATAVVRPHVTLETLAALFAPALTGHDNAALADGVRIHGSGGFKVYYLRGDGASWFESGGAADRRTLVIPSDESVVLDLKSGARRLVQLGVVRTTAFRKNLRSGDQAYATGYPLDVSLAAINARADPGQAAALRWVGSNNAAQADSGEVFSPGLNSFVRFYLRGDGLGWRQLGRASDRAHEPLLRTNAMIILRRTQADATYRALPPFTL